MNGGVSWEEVAVQVAAAVAVQVAGAAVAVVAAVASGAVTAVVAVVPGGHWAVPGAVRGVDCLAVAPE